MIIGLTGTLGAGKDAAAKVFMKHGFEYHSLSEIIRNELRKRGIEITLESLTTLGNELREKDGPNILARVIIERIKANEETHSLVVSIRNPSELAELRKEKDFVMVAIDAPIDMRYDRIHERARNEDKLSFKDFKEVEDRQKEGDENMQQLVKVIEQADYKIENNGTLEEFQEKVEDLVDFLKRGKNE